MRTLIFVLIILFFIFVGIAFGALNAELVGYDLGFARIEVPKGAAVMAALLAGWILGGIVAWLGAGTRHRRPRREGKTASIASRSADDA